MSAWGGVLRYVVQQDGSSLVAASGIPASSVADPVGLAFRSSSSEVLVGNRAGGGVGSISRFIWDHAAQTFAPNGTITGNGLAAVTQVAINPVTGELFAANTSGGGGVSRFMFDQLGNAVPNGTIGAGPAVLGVNVAPDGRRLYLTYASNGFDQFDLATGTKLTPVVVSGASILQQIAFRGNTDMYVAGIGAVFRFGLDANDNPTLVQTISGADSTIGIAFSPDGGEMFTGGHLNANVIDRYVYTPSTDSWTATTKVTTTSSLGYYLVLPP